MGSKKTVVLLFFIASFSPKYSIAQKQDSSIFSQPITLDSFVLRSGFDVNAFIRRVQRDTTFYKAFKSIHLVAYGAVNDFKIYDDDGSVTATMLSHTHQEVANGCRTTKVLDEKTTGDFYKRDGDYNYYTAGLFAHLFFSKVPVCNEADVVAGWQDIHGNGQMEKSEYELKQLMFNPGAKVSGVPFMGDRASIFEPGEAEKYTFKIAQETYNGVDCFVFTITPKAGYEHAVIYDELTTWFRKSDFSIVARDYSLSYHTLVYDFDVRMKVRMQQVGKKLYPTSIDYAGNWHVLTKKRERVKCAVTFSY